jgi:cobaltochelatase CobS
MNVKEVRAFAKKFGLEPLEEKTPLTPELKPGYNYPPSQLLEIVGFFVMSTHSESTRGMKLQGPKGCGKTAMVEQFHAAMNYPLIIPAISAQTELDDLLGKLTPTESGWRRTAGPLQAAGQGGYSIFFDEYNVLNSGTITALNRAIEGGRIDIPETGESILFKNGFRVFAACNPNDKSLGYFGRNAEDASNKDRFWSVKFDYPKPDEETPIIEAILQSHMAKENAAEFAPRFVEIANRIRKQYMGNNESGGALDVTMSTRALKCWVHSFCIFGASKNPYLFGLERTLLNDASPESRTAIINIVEDVLGVSPTQDRQ